MEIIKMAREMGRQIQNSEEYKRVSKARAVNDSDEQLQDLIGEFSLKKIELQREMSNGKGQETEEFKQKNKQINELYNRIMENENMKKYQEASKELEQILKDVNAILGMCINGQDPDTCQISPSCGSGCSGCSGCQ